MAKIRVYGTCQGSEHDQQEPYRRIKDIDIDVEIKSHMSALEDEAVAQIKAGLFGRNSETVVEHGSSRPSSGAAGKPLR